MRILTPAFVERYTGKLLNIHPSLLPHFPGKQAYLDAYNANVFKSGVTVHYVDEGVDTGEIILQDTFVRKEGDSIDDFIKRGQELEYKVTNEVSPSHSKQIQ